MKIFISWSGERSKGLARALSSWLKIVINRLHPWMSDTDLPKGVRWQREIGQKLSQYRVGIICVTPENQDSRWMLFEAGALSRKLHKSRVCPVLLGMDPSKLKGPLSQFQATTFARDDMFKLIKTLNRGLGVKKLAPDQLKKRFTEHWPRLAQKIRRVARIGIPSSNLRAVVDALHERAFSEAPIGRRACFDEDFERHALYKVVCSAAKQRLYFFGRKNRKLFDKEHGDFFSGLPARLAECFDFRCLFLNPKAPKHVILEAHADSDFRSQLTRCIGSARKFLHKYKINPNSICRAHNTHRHTALIVVDDAVLFTPVQLDVDGKARSLTGAPFEIVDATAPLGKGLVDYFEATWERATLLGRI